MDGATSSTWAAWGSREIATRAPPMPSGTATSGPSASGGSTTTTAGPRRRSSPSACRDRWRIVSLMASDRLGALAQVRLRIPLLVVGGVLGALAFPRTDWWLFAWAWLAPALCCALARSPREALADGWLAGTVFFVILLRWLDYTFGAYSAISWAGSRGGSWATPSTACCR